MNRKKSSKVRYGYLHSPKQFRTNWQWYKLQGEQPQKGLSTSKACPQELQQLNPPHLSRHRSNDPFHSRKSKRLVEKNRKNQRQRMKQSYTYVLYMYLRISTDNFIPRASTIKEQSEFYYSSCYHNRAEPQILVGRHFFSSFVFDQLFYSLYENLKSCSAISKIKLEFHYY